MCKQEKDKTQLPQDRGFFLYFPFSLSHFCFFSLILFFSFWQKWIDRKITGILLKDKENLEGRQTLSSYCGPVLVSVFLYLMLLTFHFLPPSSGSLLIHLLFSLFNYWVYHSSLYLFYL